MAFRFKKKEDFQAGFHRIATEQVARALAEWSRKNRAIAVHETRKCLKRLRSLLRLVRPALSPQDFKRENANLRDIARELSTSRDAQVMRETIQLLRQNASPTQQEALDRLANQIDGTQQSANGGDEGPDPAHTAAALREAGERLQKLALAGTDFEVVSPGFKRTYRKGRKAMATMQAAYDEEASHEWRKCVQAHWRQLLLLSAAWPEFFELRVSLARRLSDVLGQDHDLAVLLAFAQGPASGVLGKAGLSDVRRLVEKRQKELRNQAFRDGRVLYADRPSGLRNLVRRYWNIAGKRPKSEVVPFREPKTGLQIQKQEQVKRSGSHHDPSAKPAVAESSKPQVPSKPARRKTTVKKTAPKAAPVRKPKAVPARRVPTKT
jgi:CHAD domain